MPAGVTILLPISCSTTRTMLSQPDRLHRPLRSVPRPEPRPMEIQLPHSIPSSSQNPPDASSHEKRPIQMSWNSKNPSKKRFSSIDSLISTSNRSVRVGRGGKGIWFDFVSEIFKMTGKKIF